MKGFVTIATGKDRYYILAHNLLLSYRFHAKEPVPFAILCDRQNEWTEGFDKVVIMEDPAFSYSDKLRIMDLSPFDETIFIDADCLVYRDLDGLWGLFKDGPDIGLLGLTLPADSQNGWWKAENLGELEGKVDYKIMCQGGMYYVRNNGKDLPSFMQTCKFILDHYLDYHFSIFETIPEDETVLSLAAAVHHFQPVSDFVDVFAYYPLSVITSANILKGRLRYDEVDGSGKLHTKGYAIHFGTANALGAKNDGLYGREVARIRNKMFPRRSWKARLVCMGRYLTNHSALFKAFAGIFPKKFRNRFNNVKFL